MNKVNLKKFEAWGEYNIPRIKKVHPYIPKRTIAVIEKIGLPPLIHLQSFNSMFIHGEAGTGKTVMAVQYMLGHIAFQQACMSPISATFIGVSELLMQFRESFGKSTEETERGILERYGKVGLLVLDDFGTQMTTDWALTMLYMLINRRYDDMSPIIITSNYTLEELGDSLGDYRIPSRLHEMCDIIENKKQYRH
jgi:DNA replication protein DnaC